jgi:hypothetical protein
MVNMNPIYGIQPTCTAPVRVFSRAGAMVVGDVLAFDIIGSDAAVTTFGVGETTSGWANVRPASAGEIAGTTPTVFCVCTEAAADDAEGMVLVTGYVVAFVIDANASIVVGDRLAVTATKEFNGGTAVAGEAIVAIANQALTTPTTRTLAKVYTDGWMGWYGIDHA